VFQDGKREEFKLGIPESGKKLNRQGLTEEEFLSAYDASKFDRPSVTADLLVFTIAGDEKTGDKKQGGKVDGGKKLKLLMVDIRKVAGNFAKH